jgi:5-(carboxyamino)imidazole ribonucleotide mutase
VVRTVREVPMIYFLLSNVADKPLVAVIMGSTSDWDTMCHTAELLERFNVSFEKEVVSAHRTPVWMAEFAQGAEARGIQVIVAGAGGAAHLPGMVASHTVLPVLGVPVQSASLQGLDSLLSIVQMPGGVPVGTLAIGKPGAINAGLLAVGILSLTRPELRERLRQFRAEQTTKVRQDALP